MEMILYLPRQYKSGTDLIKMIRSAVLDQHLEIFSSIDDLSERLHEPMLDVSVALFCAINQQELQKLIDLHDLIGDLKIVLVLPDNRKNMMEKAHLLRPRFIASSQSDFKHLGDVIGKMMKVYDGKK